MPAEQQAAATKTIELKGWIFGKVSHYSDKIDYEFSEHDYEKWAREDRSAKNTWADYKKLVPHTVIVEVPDFDARAVKLSALELERESLRAAFTVRLNEINDRIAKLQALTFEPSEA